MKPQPRTQQGKYAHKKRGINWLKVIFFFIIIGGLYYGYTKIELPTLSDTYKNTPQSDVAPTIVDKHQSEIDKIKERENFKKRVENQAKQVFLQEEIADREAKITALKAEIAKVQSELELTRKEELSLQ